MQICRIRSWSIITTSNFTVFALKGGYRLLRIIRSISLSPILLLRFCTKVELEIIPAQLEKSQLI